MVYINHNNTLSQLESIIHHDIHNISLNYMPEKFNEEQLHAINLLKKRIQLEEIVEESVSFNRRLSFNPRSPDIHLIQSVEELVDVFKLRSSIYTKIGYQKEFPDIIEGLNFDSYDKSSAILYYGEKGKSSGSVRLIFDSNNKLPIESLYSIENFRNSQGLIGEFSRLVADNETKGLSLEFKYLMGGLYNIVIHNGVTTIMSAIKEEHYKLYSKFGAVSLVDTLETYGELKQTSYIISWDPKEISPFFRRAFL